ncbi:MAG: hypothetical protein IJ325_10540 [Clostridia bacterium]|nr:hypothetical protein [Clostridia bacterium]
MKKQKQKHRKESRAEHLGFLAILAVLFIIPIIMLVVLVDPISREADSGNNVPVEDLQSPETEIPASEYSETINESETVMIDDPIEFPIRLENGKLEIERVFLYDGLNPDCNNSQGNSITALEVRNLSTEYLEKGLITLDSDEGKTIHFAIRELPAGKSVMVFSSENASSLVDTVFGNIRYETIFDLEASMHSEQISISTKGTRITLKNNTDVDINEIVVYCRSVLEDRYFGGITYNYTINSLPAHGTAEFEAVDCILGFAEVVRVEINNS